MITQSDLFSNRGIWEELLWMVQYPNRHHHQELASSQVWIPGLHWSTGNSETPETITTIKVEQTSGDFFSSSSSSGDISSGDPSIATTTTTTATTAHVEGANRAFDQAVRLNYNALAINYLSENNSDISILRAALSNIWLSVMKMTSKKAKQKPQPESWFGTKWYLPFPNLTTPLF